MAKGPRPHHRHHKTEFLVPAQRTWEPEERLLPAFPALVVDYTSQWVRETTVFKIEESDSTQVYPTPTPTLSYSYFVEKPHACQHCDKTLSTKEDLDVHIIRTHRFLKPFQCLSCDRSFSHKSNLAAHVHTHARRKTLECEQCNQRFSLLSSLRKHFRSHKMDKRYECNLCKKRFALESHLLEHACACTNERHQCTCCRGSFSHHLLLRNHICPSGNVKSFQCNFCDKGFNTLSHMVMHRTRSHTYRQSHQLNRLIAYGSHVLTHTALDTEEGLHECNSCDKKFSSISRLIKHSQRHKQNESYICGNCDKSFRTNATLIVHERTHTTKSNIST